MLFSAGVVGHGQAFYAEAVARAALRTALRRSSRTSRVRGNALKTRRVPILGIAPQASIVALACEDVQDWGPAANCLVRPMRWSNCRSGSRPASEVSGASETSIWMGKGSKKSKANWAAGRRFKADPAVFDRMWARG